MQPARKTLTAYQPTKTYRSDSGATRGFGPLLRSIAKLAALVLFMVTAMSALTLRLHSIYGVTHIAGWTSYTVQPGDTLSGLAARFDGRDYMPTVVQEIETHNGLGSAAIRAGDTIQVPEGATK